MIMGSKQLPNSLFANGISIHRSFIENDKIEASMSSFKKQLKNKKVYVLMIKKAILNSQLVYNKNKIHYFTGSIL